MRTPRTGVTVPHDTPMHSMPISNSPSPLAPGMQAQNMVPGSGLAVTCWHHPVTVPLMSYFQGYNLQGQTWPHEPPLGGSFGGTAVTPPFKVQHPRADHPARPHLSHYLQWELCFFSVMNKYQRSILVYKLYTLYEANQLDTCKQFITSVAVWLPLAPRGLQVNSSNTL